MTTSRFFIFMFAFCFCRQVPAQEWRSELYAADWNPEVKTFYVDKFLQDFSYAGYHRGEKNVPSGTGKVIDVSKAPYHIQGNGQEDVTIPLQRVIDEAPRLDKPVVIYLPAGTYRLSPQKDKDYCLLIQRSEVVLRGAGAGKTFLFNSSTDMRGKDIVKIAASSSWKTGGKNKQRITKDLVSPARVIPVADASGFRKGDRVIVRNYIDNSWIADHGMLEYWRDGGAALGGLMYCREVLSVDKQKNELVLDIPIRYSLLQQQNSVVYIAPRMLTEVGIEDLSIGNRQSFGQGDWSEESYRQKESPSYNLHDSWAVEMSQVYNGWIRNVRSYCPEGNSSGAHLLSNGIKLWQTANVSLLQCDFSRPQYGGGGGNGYMYRIMGNETLVSECAAHLSRHGFVLSGMNASGNVFFRCLDENTGTQTGLTGSEKTSGSGSDHHMHFSHSNLFDQCRVENSFFAAGWRKWGGSVIHGLTAAHSAYWNISSNGSQPFAVQSQQGRYGYVVGTSGDKPEVSTDVWMKGTESITDPVDFVEGIGKGRGLQPQSLYLDQKHRRLGKD